MNLYFILSGEHKTLPKAELYAILEAESIKYNRIMSLDQLEIIKAEALDNNDLIGKIIKRASMIKEGGYFLGIFDVTNLNEILQCVKNIDWSFLSGRTFAVRVKRIKEYFNKLKSYIVEREVGAAILSNIGSAKVDLKKPNYLIRVVLTENSVMFGIKIAELNTKQFIERKPRSRPFFHPGVLSPKISRLFVNLSRPKRGDLFLDPFCGVGGFIVEAYLLGLKCMCSELRLDLVKGAKKNFDFYDFFIDGLVQADATSIPWRRVDAIATDPPYGRSTSTLGRDVKNIVKGFLEETIDIIRRGGYIVYALPHTIEPYETIPTNDLVVVETHRMKVHKSLTRVIVVTRRI